MKRHVLYTSLLLNSVLGHVAMADNPAANGGRTVPALAQSHTILPHEQKLKLRAKAGNSQAQLELAHMYESRHNQAGETEMKKWYRRSAMNGNAEAQFLIGLMYIDGEMLDGDRETGMFWVEQAAEQGHQRAQVVYDSLQEEEFAMDC